MKKVTMQDIADKLGVSKVTVSKYFKGSDDISIEMKKNISKVADELGYVYNSIKRVSVGVLTSSLFMEKDENFYTRIYKILTEEAMQYNIQLLLNVIKDKDEESCKHPYILEAGNIDALIVLGQLKKKFIKYLLGLNIPIILMDFHYRGIDTDTIVSNNFQASYEITSHLIDYGHKEIGFIGNIKTSTSIQDRYLGFVKAMLENDLEIDDSYLIKERDEENNLIDIYFPEKLPTAYVCNSDYAAYNLTKKLLKKGYKVPEDISVVGFDDVQYSEFSEPKLTTVRVSRRDMAKTALKRVVKRITEKNVDTKMFVINSEIIYRDSVKRIDSTDTTKIQ